MISYIYGPLTKDRRVVAFRVNDVSTPRMVNTGGIRQNRDRIGRQARHLARPGGLQAGPQGDVELPGARPHVARLAASTCRSRIRPGVGRSASFVTGPFDPVFAADPAWITDRTIRAALSTESAL